MVPGAREKHFRGPRNALAGARTTLRIFGFFPKDTEVTEVAEALPHLPRDKTNSERCFSGEKEKKALSCSSETFSHVRRGGETPAPSVTFAHAGAQSRTRRCCFLCWPVEVLFQFPGWGVPETTPLAFAFGGRLEIGKAPRAPGAVAAKRRKFLALHAAFVDMSCFRKNERVYYGVASGCLSLQRTLAVHIEVRRSKGWLESRGRDCARSLTKVASRGREIHSWAPRSCCPRRRSDAGKSWILECGDTDVTRSKN